MTQWLHDGYGLLGSALIVLVMISTVLRPLVKNRRVRGFVLGLVLVLSFIPVGGTSLTELVRGAGGDLAIPTFLLLVLAVMNCLGGRNDPNARPTRGSGPFRVFFGGTLTLFFLSVLAVGCVFYPMTLGFSLVDPYAWGYSPRWMLPICLTVVVAFEFSGQRTAASLILLAVAAYAAGLLESTNLWDYLLDPVLFLICFVGCIVKAVSLACSNRRVPTGAS